MSEIQQSVFAAVQERLKERGGQVEVFLQTCLADTPMPSRLREAMNYSLLAGGKRLRPALCLSCVALCGGNEEQAMPFAAAIEMIHTYSLIHDDLPAMDNDDLRRGRPSSHKAFDEATAILAGDALLTDAFSFMAAGGLGLESLSPRYALAALAEVALAAGSGGMVGGQVLDMVYTGQESTPIESLRYMHSCKTGAMFRASCVAGALLSGATSDRVEALRAYGAAFGAAFQIEDDILDVTCDTAHLGKPAGSDEAQGKSTYPSLLGLTQCRLLAMEKAERAVQCLSDFSGSEAEFLKGLALMLAERVRN